MSYLRRLLDGARALLSSLAPRRVAAPFCMILALFAVSACSSTRGGPIAYEMPPNFQTPDAPRAPSFGADYRIATGDTLGITVFQVEALSKDYQVDLAGNIAFPLIGDVEAVGRTTARVVAI